MASLLEKAISTGITLERPVCQWHSLASGIEMIRPLGRYQTNSGQTKYSVRCQVSGQADGRLEVRACQALTAKRDPWAFRKTQASVVRHEWKSRWSPDGKFHRRRHWGLKIDRAF
jgi:hypothetical protein